MHFPLNRARKVIEAVQMLSPPRSAYDANVVSFGGAGTTFFLKFLQERMAINSWNSLHDGIKHANSPNHPIIARARVDRAVYIYSNPMRAVMSLFRRGYQEHMVAKLNSERHRTAWQYRKYVRDNLTQVTFEEFLACGKDIFGINRHWNNWTKEPLKFPVIYIRFRELYGNLPAIFDFLEIPRREIAEFPTEQKRNTSVDDLDSETLKRLRAIYGDMADEIDSLPGVFVREAGPAPGIRLIA